MSSGDEITENQLEEIKELEYKKNTPVPLTQKQEELRSDLIKKSKEKDLTVKQEAALKDLNEKKNAKTGSITEKQQEHLDELIEKRDKKPELTKGVKMTCVKIFGEWYYERRRRTKSKYLKKGIEVEEDSITLLSLVDSKMYLKNEGRHTNKYFTGEHDISDKKKVEDSSIILDAKSCWDMETFQKSKFDDLVEPRYKGQLNIYQNIHPHIEKLELAYCLVNSPLIFIMDEISKLNWEFGVNEETLNIPEKYIKECINVERNHIFDMGLFKHRYKGYDSKHDEFGIKWEHDIPEDERVKKFNIDIDKDYQAKAEERVVMCRDFIGNKLIKNKSKFK